MHRSKSWTRRVIRELIFSAVLLALGIIALPAAIYFTGSRLLEPYAGGQGSIGDFYDSFLIFLGNGSPMVWFLALSPWLAISLLRTVFALLRRGRLEPAAPKPAPAPRSRTGRRPPRRQRQEPSLS